MTYKVEERYLGGVLCEKVVELNAAYEQARVATDENLPTAYGLMVTAMVSMFHMLPENVKAALTEKSGRLPLEVQWRTLSSGETTPESALLAVYGALGELRQFVSHPFVSARPIEMWRRWIDGIFAAPLKELLSWCPVSEEVRAENLQGDARLVRVYNDGNIICSKGNRCYCEGDGNGVCSGVA